ncbi:FAD dependent oxidoreductase superfamily [Mytilinidion resinicola]|uniref:FAD dependent oxidoreductase superfamily n=1 Tax=Mytilinidion resinicola TaxID=574789 RepID=A0A6A6Y4I2_9PEZI|nr:FAD dependent oxidoreductase superfamily [Mytilinidion resinicola]KAF2803428.1 FAD dependent oxidoreductase superfamily [Mytilinidion resinicola]
MDQVLPVPNPTKAYWLSEPHELARFRSTPDLPATCDVAIIGSGMAGITTAYHLLHSNKQPPNVVILEARELCSGATGRNGGHCKVKVPTFAGFTPGPGSSTVDDMAVYVHGIINGLKQIVEEEELDCEFELRRSFDIQLDDDESKRLKRIYDESAKAGSTWTRTVDYIDERFAGQITSINGANTAFTGPACSFWPYKFVSQLLARLLAQHPRSLNFQTMTPATSVTLSEDGSSAIHTSRGSFKAEKVVFATNPYTSGLISQFNDIITPIRGMTSHIVPKQPIHPHLSNTYNIDFGPEKGTDYLNPRPDGSIVVGGGKWLYNSDRPSWFNNFDDSMPFPPQTEEYWEGYMQRNFRGWEESGAELDKVWVGIMGITPDGWPHVGRVPGVKNQWMLAGFNGGGMSMILTVAKAVATMVKEDAGFDEVAGGLGVPDFWGTSEERLRVGKDEDLMVKRK